MASALLRSDVAVSAEIMEVFIEMHRMLISNASLFHRLEKIGLKQLKADQKFETIFKAMESEKPRSEKGIFYSGQVFDACAFVSNIIRTARNFILLLDNHADETILSLLGKRGNDVFATIYSKNISNRLRLDPRHYSSKCPNIEIEIFSNAHDLFLFIGDHIGASRKDPGKKWFCLFQNGY